MIPDDVDTDDGVVVIGPVVIRVDAAMIRICERET